MPVLGRVALEGTRRRSATIRHENVDPAECFRAGRHHALHVGRPAHVRHHGLHHGARRTDGVGGLSQRGFAARAQHQPSALVRELLRHRAPQSAARGGDEGDLASQAEIHRYFRWK